VQLKIVERLQMVIALNRLNTARKLILTLSSACVTHMEWMIYTKKFGIPSLLFFPSR